MSIMIAGIFKSLSVPKLGSPHSLSLPGLRMRFSTNLYTSFTVVPRSISTCIRRQVCQSSFLQAQPDNASENTRQAIKDFKDIPGPWKIPLLGITPEIMKMDPKRGIQEVTKFPQKYGKIFKMKLAPGLPEFVCLFDPEDVKVVFRSEGKYPQRLPLHIWEESRTAQGKPVGLFFLNGEEWHKQRRPISKFMAVPRKVAEYHEPFNEVTTDLIDGIRRSRDNHDMLCDTTALLQKWAFESVNVFLLGKRLGCLEEHVPPDCQEFIYQIDRFFTASHTLLFGLPFHKLYATKAYKELLNSFMRLFEISMAHIKERLDELKEKDTIDDDEPPAGMDFLHYMSKANKMPIEMITTNTIDLMSAGVDTTSHTLLWTLYLLAVNPEAQTKLREEVVRVVGSDIVVTPTHIQHMSYMRDCIKEATRMYSIVPNNTRILDHEIVLSGYRIPAGVCIMMPIVAGGAQADNFPEPHKFMPERWSRDNKEPPNAFASLPFGFGARMCVGRRVAELELHIALSQLIRTFRVKFRDEKPMDYVQNLFLNPERRFDLAFVDL